MCPPRTIRTRGSLLVLKSKAAVVMCGSMPPWRSVGVFPGLLGISAALALVHIRADLVPTAYSSPALRVLRGGWSASLLLTLRRSRLFLAITIGAPSFDRFKPGRTFMSPQIGRNTRCSRPVTMLSLGDVFEVLYRSGQPPLHPSVFIRITALPFNSGGT